MNIQKIINFVLGLALVVLFVATFGHGKALGDATVSNYPTWYYNGIVIGPQNTLLSQITKGTCNMTGAASMGTLTNATLSCAAPGAKVGDVVFMTSTTAGAGATTNSGFPIIGATVSATDVITVTVVNSTGGTNTPSGAAINGIQYLVVR